jgi:hypothetical protein
LVRVGVVLAIRLYVPKDVDNNSSIPLSCCAFASVAEQIVVEPVKNRFTFLNWFPLIFNPFSFFFFFFFFFFFLI